MQAEKAAIVVRVPVEVHRELLQRARAGERSVAAEVRLAVREHLTPPPEPEVEAKGE